MKSSTQTMKLNITIRLALVLLTVFFATSHTVNSAGCPTPDFAAAANFGVGLIPQSATTGDFNGDGDLDLAIANVLSDNVSILLGDGLGGFAAAVNFGAGDGPKSVTTGDFNTDGNLDLATANVGGGGNNVSILLGDGLGSFGAPASLIIGVSADPFGITTGDFDGDGHLDLATANQNLDNVSIFLGNGLGGFAAAVNFGVGDSPYSVTTGDFNADGDLDIATANKNLDNVSILLGNGLGSFAAAVNFGAGDGPQSVATGDFNADGNLDLATANLSDNVSILLGDGVGGFAAPVNFAADNGPRSIASGDFNVDGNLDLAAANFLGDNVSVLLGDGLGGFAPAANFYLGEDSGPTAITAGDFNSDGSLDLVPVSQTYGNVSVLLNNCTPPTDTTPPVVTPNVIGTLGNDGWYTSNVGVSWAVTDVESAVSSQNGCDVQNVTVDTAGITFTCSATSGGGTASESVTVKRDATAPVISFDSRTPANPNGWNNTNVLVAWNCSDALSGVLNSTTSQTVSGEGQNQSATGTCEDNAGHTASDTQSSISIDKTAPALSPAVSPNPVALGGSATASANAADALSGIGSENCGTPDTSTAGNKTVNCTASDLAGNTANASAGYTVNGPSYNFTGFFQPVDNLPILNEVNAGRSIPVKFSLGGNFGLNIFAAGYPASGIITCNSSSPADVIEETVNAGGSSLTYDAASDRYHYVWKTDRNWKGQCRMLIVKLNDGNTYFAQFRFK